jgi:hypothetical protein
MGSRCDRGGDRFFEVSIAIAAPQDLDSGFAALDKSDDRVKLYKYIHHKCICLPLRHARVPATQEVIAPYTQVDEVNSRMLLKLIADLCFCSGTHYIICLSAVDGQSGVRHECIIGVASFFQSIIDRRFGVHKESPAITD